MKEIVVESSAFIGLKSIVQGGTRLEPYSSVATMTRCTKSLKSGQKLIGEHIIDGEFKEMKLNNAAMVWMLVKEFILELIVRVYMLTIFVITVGLCIAVGCYTRQAGASVAITVSAVFIAVLLLIGVVYGRFMTMTLHPCKPHVFSGADYGFSLWLGYLQATYYTQMYTLPLCHGSWIRALLEKLNGADTPLDAQWYASSIRDHPLLKVGKNAVLDSSSYLVGHSGQADGTLRFATSSVGEEAVLHPYAIMLDGQQLGDKSTLDMWSHSHLESFLKSNTFWANSPARPDKVSRINTLYQGLVEEQKA